MVSEAEAVGFPAVVLRYSMTEGGDAGAGDIITVEWATPPSPDELVRVTLAILDRRAGAVTFKVANA